MTSYWRIAIAGLRGSSRGADLATATERYRHYAAECIRLTRKTSNSADKDLLLQMSEHWLRLAHLAERKDFAERKEANE